MSNHGLLRLSVLAAFFCLPAVSGCVTINVYLPTKEIRAAAREIVDEVRPSLESSDSPPGKPVSSAGAAGRLVLLTAWIGAPQDEDRKSSRATKVRLNVSTPKIKAIKKTLKARYKRLHPFYERLVVGEGQDGYLSIRDARGLGLKEKRDLRLLTGKENEDRKQLYTEIAIANKIPRKEIAKIGGLFSAEWQRKSKVGWWIQEGKRQWVKKKPPPAKRQKRKDAAADGSK